MKLRAERKATLVVLLVTAVALAWGASAYAESEMQPATEAFEGADLLPPGAEPGECYARLFVPPTYRTETEQVLKHQASERLEIIPPATCGKPRK